MCPIAWKLECLAPYKVIVLSGGTFFFNEWMLDHNFLQVFVFDTTAQTFLCVLYITGKWPRSLRQHHDQPRSRTPNFHSWGALRPWSWRWVLWEGTYLGLLTTSSCKGTLTGCCLWAWRQPTSAGTSTSETKSLARTPTWSGKRCGAKTCRRFTVTAWSRHHRSRLSIRGVCPPRRTRAPQCPLAPPGLARSTWRWPRGGATDSKSRENVDSLQSQITSRWRDRSFWITKRLPEYRGSHLDPADGSLNASDLHLTWTWTLSLVNICSVVYGTVVKLIWLGLLKPPLKPFTLNFAAQGSYQCTFISSPDYQDGY